MIVNFINLFSDHTVQTVFLGSTILGITSGCLGSFAVLRQQSLLGDAISHATLPGVAIAFLITQTKNPLILLIGAGIAGWIGTIFVKIITEHTRIKKDAALGIILSVFFGFGLMLLSIIQRMSTATKAGLDKFLFGNAATLLKSDVTTMFILSVLVLLLLFISWKEFKLIVFDYDYAKSIGINVRFFDVLLTTLIVVAIVIGLQTVGVILMSAMVVAPAAAARQWTDRLSLMIVIASIIGSMAGTLGAVTSSMFTHLPTGPMIVVFLSIFVLVSLLCAPHRGILWDMIRHYRHKESIQMAAMLKNLMLFSEIDEDPYHAHDISALEAIGRGSMTKTMDDLRKKGFVKQDKLGKWALTPKGYKVANRIEDEVNGNGTI